jgi:hypothetical protein
MVHAGAGGLDTPRTNVGDTTFTSKQFDFDISPSTANAKGWPWRD